ncbi:hypothetical protein [Bradyrhizobium sp. UFLA03-84]|uniref:hypothetical protein n=1 Tax=Bradyrhizobium sp. UFLA03-84 TaxID=418599 RepID=UPI001FD99454|nr:hypothetical protein [Bradyrhizobium sp. UFLA03-84]
MRCHAEPRVRVVHLRGNGPNFCAGGDLREFASEDEQLGDFLREVTAYLQMAVGALVRLNSVPRAMATSKRLLWTGLGIGVESCLPEEARTFAELSATADAREGLAAVLEKRTPVFGGRWAWRAQSAHW